MADRSVVIRLRGDIGDFTSKMRQAGASARRELGGELNRVATQNRAAMDQLGSSAGKVGLAAVAGLGLATKAAISWESAWAGVTKTVDGSAEQYAILEDQLRSLAKELPASHAEIAGVAEAAGQLGIAREDIADFTETMIALGETTNLTADEAATSIAQMANVMGTAPEDIDNLGAALVDLGNNGASTERQIIQMAQGISGAAAIVGLSEADVLGIANAVASMGIEVEAGGTSISKVLATMSKAVSEGGPKLEAFARAAGVTGEEFAQAFGERPAEAFASFVQGLGRIQASGGNVFAVLNDLQLADQRVSRALLGMASAGDLLTDSLELGAQAWEDNTALAIEAAKRYDTTEARIQRSINRINDAGIELGETMLPIVAGVAEGAGDLASAFASLPDPVQQAAVALGGIVAITGSGLWFGSKVIGSVVDTRRALEQLSATAPRTARILSRSLSGIGRAAGVAAGILALDAALKTLNKTMEGSVEGGEELTTALLDLSDGRIKSLGADFDDFAKNLDEIGTGGLMDVFEWADSIPAVSDAVGLLNNILPGENTQEQFRKFKDQLEAIDRALSGMVASGGPELAREAFESLAVSMNLSATGRDELMAGLPAFQEALAGAANQARIAGQESEGAASGIDIIGDSAHDATRDVQSLADAFDALSDNFLDEREAARNVRDSLRRIQEALADYREEHGSLKGAFKEGTESGDQFAKMLDGLARDYQAQIEATAELSGSQQQTMRVYRESRQTLIEVATQLGLTKKEAKEYADQVLGTPSFIKTTFDADTTLAESKIDRFIQQQSGRKIFIGVDGSVSFSPGGRKAFATGGAVPNFGTATSDSVPAWLSAGEHVWTAAEVAAAGGHSVMYAMRAAVRGYANGGAVVAGSTKQAPVFASRPGPAQFVPAGGFTGPVEIQGTVTVVNPETGEARIRGIVRSEIGSASDLAGTRSRMREFG